MNKSIHSTAICKTLSNNEDFAINFDGSEDVCHKQSPKVSEVPPSIKTTSYNLSSKLVDGTTIDVTMNISDFTHSERDKLNKHAIQKNLSMNIPLASFYDKSKTLASLSENHTLNQD